MLTINQSCSFLRFLIRALVQFVLLTPKPPTFVQPPDQQPFVGAILGVNTLCIALHLWLSPAVGTEATRGYLHGGMAMDFIGQEGPTSRIVLVLLDVLVMALQLVHFTAHISRKRLKDGAAATTTTPQAPETAPAPSQGQDLDSEERGVRHSVELQRQDDIEMQTLNASGRPDAPSPNIAEDDSEPTNNERASLLSSPPQTDMHIFDAFHSGQIVLADLNVWRASREQFLTSRKAASSAEQREARRASYRAQLTRGLFQVGVARLGR